MKLKQTETTFIKCVSCDNQVAIKIFTNLLHPDYGLPVVTHRKKKACSIDCLNKWQKSVNWEDRVGKEVAESIRESRKEQIKKFNPSTIPEIAEQISRSVKLYIQENPECRLGENNPFFGHTHSRETIDHWINTKSGKLSFNDEQAERQRNNSPKKDNHPNWLGGTSHEDYGPEFTRKLKITIKESYDYTCQSCNTKTQILDVHHIDYDKKNNSISNLVPLCKTCHGKSNFNREEWKTFFQNLLK